MCPGVEGPNLAAAALAAYREATGWDAPPQRLEIDKRVPVAAGMGGGSSDAAAALRLAAHAAGRPDDERLRDLAFALGADVPALLDAEPALAWGAGEHVERLPALPSHAVLVLPAAAPLSTAAVFAEADRLGLGRPPEALRAPRGCPRLGPRRRVPRAARCSSTTSSRPRSRSRPPSHTLADARGGAGAEHALVAGSDDGDVRRLPGRRQPGALPAAAAAALAVVPRVVIARPVGPRSPRHKPKGTVLRFGQLCGGCGRVSA